MTFAKRLKAERIRLEMTQGDAAVALGLPVFTYRAYEYGRNDPPLSLFERLVEAGFDAELVATGHSGKDKSAARMDWSLISELAGEILEWSASRPRPLSNSEVARFLALAYSWSQALGAERAKHDLREVMGIA
jgi:transcriptional regulator with XRE-family HTH domain